MKKIVRFAIAAALAAPGCGGGDEGVSAGDGRCGVGPLSALSTNVDNAEGTTSYVLLTPDVAAPAELDAARALEVAGGGVVSSPGRGDVIFVGRYESPVIERYAVDARCGFTKQGEIGLGAYGIRNVYHKPQFISDTKAYFVDQETLQLIVWNPAAMTIDRVVPLPELAYPDLGTVLDPDPKRVGDKLYLAAGFAEWDTPYVTPEVRVLVLDTDDETFTIASDVRTGWLYHSVVGADGYVYFAPPAWMAAQHRMRPDQPKPVILRIAPGATTFDPDFAVDLSARVGGQPAGTIAGGPGGTFFVRALDPASFTITPETDVNTLSGAAAWVWYQLDPTSAAPAAPVSAPFLGPSAGSPMTFELGGAWYANESSADYSRTTLVRTDAALPTAGVSFSGWANAIARVRQ